MQILDDYLNTKQKVWNYFGYVEDWVAIPIGDARDYYWRLVGEDTNNPDEVRFAETKEDLFDEKKCKYYINEIYRQRFLPKWVYRGEEYTMICVDTHTDGNKFLQIFDNSKEI